jgi:Caspase domain
MSFPIRLILCAMLFCSTVQAQLADSGKAKIIFFRDSAYGLFISYHISVNDIKVTSLAPYTYTELSLPPGKYKLTAERGYDRDGIVVEAVANEKIFLYTEGMGLPPPNPRFVITSEKEARPRMVNLVQAKPDAEMTRNIAMLNPSDKPVQLVKSDTDPVISPEVTDLQKVASSSDKEAALKEAALKEAALKEAALKEAALKEAAYRDESSKKLTAINQNVEISTQARFSKEPAQSISRVDSISRVKLTALIIGNGSYKSGFLKNPRNDAEEISKKLAKFNFDATTVYDTSRDRLIQTLDAYSNKSRDSDVSILFYAGHGVQVNGMNYLIPVDMDLASVSQVTLRGIPLNNVIEEFMPSKTKLIFLDACRDNPLLLSKTRNLTRGLAPVNVPSGTLIAFSTKDGSVAQDGEDKNSPFTSALLKHLDAPEDISVVLRKVRTEVKKLTNGNQEPWDYGSLEGGSLILSKIGFNN